LLCERSFLIGSDGDIEIFDILCNLRVDTFLSLSGVDGVGSVDIGCDISLLDRDTTSEWTCGSTVEAADCADISGGC